MGTPAIKRSKALGQTFSPRIRAHETALRMQAWKLAVKKSRQSQG
jgi:hypothetical protein